MYQLHRKFAVVLLAVLIAMVASSSAFGAATIVIQNNDGPSVGFNDPTPVAPVGGNPGTTLGQQRLNAFQFAANIWGATLSSTSTITVGSTWVPLECTPTTAVLGSAGAVDVWSDFSGAPFVNTWYGTALANKLAGTDLNFSTAEIRARFNVNIGNPGCFENTGWYYGLDNNHGSNVDLVTVLLHELSHGLGFQTFTNSSTGAQFNTGGSGPAPSIYDRFLFDNSAGKSWVQMTDAERQASAINTHNLVWIGSQVVGDAAGVLSPSDRPRLKVNSPASIAGTYDVGTADFGPALSSPGITGNVVQALDAANSAGPTTMDACSPLTNAGSVSGNIAIVDRGVCTFVTKVKNAQNAGAIGVIVVNNVAGLVGMTGTDGTITIPSLLITLAEGNTIKAQLGSGVNANLGVDPLVISGADPSGRPQLFTPNEVESGSSVSHWDTSAFPNQLMEPNISGDLTHNVIPPDDLTFSLMRDIGWTVSGAGTGKTGVFRPTTGELFLKNSNSSGFADTYIIFGNPGDYPIAGDWNADGIDTVGIFRNGVFYLRNTNSTGFADIVVPFGNPGDQPVVGDWDGDGVDTIGLYRNDTFLLRNSNTAGPPELIFTLGNPGDVAIAGDWNGDGIVSGGVFRPSNGIVYLKNSNTTGFADLSFVFGNAGDKPVAGDWNGDGIDTIGIYRNGLFYLSNSNATGFADIVFVLGNSDDFPIAGNWNGQP